MTIQEYKKQPPKPTKKASLCFLLKDDQILLALKKTGPGKGKWNGVGGKQEDGENIKDTALRETKEEINVTPETLDLVAILNFIFTDFLPDQQYNVQVHVFSSNKWQGEPQESEEMAPKWFKKTEIPYDQMWDADRKWVPEILQGRKILADFLYNEDGKLLEHKITNLKPNEGF